MPRKRNEDKEQSENYSKAFPTVMRHLMRNTTQAELAAYLSKTRQSITYYCDGSSSPDWETLVKIADFFNVSTDYLLGRTNEPSRQPCAADELGLSPQALNQITSIHSRKDADAVLQGLNMLIENGRILRLSGELTRFCSRVSEFVDVINHYKADNADDADNDYYKFKLAVNEDIIKMALERTITEKFPRFSGEFEIITGSRMIEFQKQLILDIFDEILRQVSHYKDFRDGILQWGDAMKWG